MKISIDENVLKKYNIPLEELLVISLVRSGVHIPDLIFQMQEEDKIKYDRDTDSYSANVYYTQLCDKVLLESDSAVPKETRLESLAKKLRDIFPKGTKAGTNYFFKSNVKDTSHKLAKFFKLYGNYTDEEIIDATQRYVDSFNGDYTYMRLLKYFIYKEENGENVSELATFLENEDATLSYIEQGTFLC